MTALLATGTLARQIITQLILLAAPFAAYGDWHRHLGGLRQWFRSVPCIEPLRIATGGHPEKAWAKVYHP
jgi:hypothetical protein